MNKSSRQYYRKLTTNSYNQDFIYYKHQKQPSGSPRFKKHQNSKPQPCQLQNQANHSKIQSMKNTLNTLFDPLSKTNSKNYNKSVVQYPTYQIKKNSQQQQAKNSKSLYDQINANANLNIKLQILTSKLRQIAQKPHFTSILLESQSKKSKMSTQRSNDDLKYLRNTQIISGSYDGIHNQKIFKKKSNEQLQMQKGKYKQLKHKQFNAINKTNKEKSKTKTDQQLPHTEVKKYVHNCSQQLRRSKSKTSSSFYYKKKQLQSSGSQTSSLKRYGKQLKNDKSLSTFEYPHQQVDQFQYSQRPRGKTIANLLYTTIQGQHMIKKQIKSSKSSQSQIQSTKIKINSYIQTKPQQKLIRKQPKKLASPQYYNQSSKNNTLSKQLTNQLFPTQICTLSPHRAQITAIIINSDGKRFLTASNDYTIKQSTNDAKYSLLRKHEGRIHCMKMIDDHLFSGGNDCKLKYQGGNFKFTSPIKQIFPHQKQLLNIATSSHLQLFSINKNITENKVPIKTHFYKICQKINKDIYFLDNHNVSIVDWRVPYPLINLYHERQFVQNWISDPYSLDFYLIRNKKLILMNNSKSKRNQIFLEGQKLRDYCWKKDRLYILGQNSLQLFQNKKNQLNYKASYPIKNQNHTTLQIKNNLWAYGTLDGNIVVNTLL